jgi:hypothetical protein
MGIFTFAAISATGVGPVAAGWIEANPHFEWRWIQWIHVMYVPFTHCNIDIRFTFSII